MNPQTFTPSAEDISDLFEELPRPVKVALLSNMQGLRSRTSIHFTEYPKEVAQYIEASGLMNVDWRANGGVRFSANDATRIIRQDLRKYLALVELHPILTV